MSDSLFDRPNEFFPDGIVFKLFQDWKEKHGKSYNHVKEEKMRLEIFKSNVKYIMEKNSKRKSDSEQLVGLTIFADMSNEEFREVYSSKMKIPFNKKNTILMRKSSMTSSCDAPPALDWRKHGVVTEVNNQGNCGSCGAFSACGSMEGINAIVTGELISLSAQELVDCDSFDSGCDGGLMDSAFEWVINNGGIDSASDYPYTASQGTCNITKDKTKVAIIDGYQDVAQEESALLCAVAQEPVNVGNGYCSSNPDDIDHAVVIVGYGSKGVNEYWIIKNSWGTSWGMEGYAHIRRNTDLPYGVCAINATASYPTKESSSSPSPHLSPALPPPSPSPSECGDYHYCPSGQTCCCELESFRVCFVQGCCPYEDGVAVINQNTAAQEYGEYLGVAKTREIDQPALQWNRNHCVEMLKVASTIDTKE
ncbi:hypothetical protein HAX54_045258 [Datura stramonium]|uniref:Uncharacterized protein n=1 Tax=Datura stramonium TaxID=4076 RepID=A0ABS8RIR3_DATST|nr:hypothetical protein [Datura stramonium]